MEMFIRSLELKKAFEYNVNKIRGGRIQATFKHRKETKWAGG